MPEGDFAAVFEMLRESKFKAMPETPTWRQEPHWGCAVLDAAGDTAEVCATPKGPLASTE